MTKKNNFIALDLDGTLLTNSKIIPDSTLTLLKTFMSNNGRIAILTSRNKADAFSVISEIYEQFYQSMYIAYDEGRNIVLPNGKIIQTDSLNIEDIKYIFSNTKQYVSQYVIFTDKGLYEIISNPIKRILFNLYHFIKKKRFCYLKPKDIFTLLSSNIWKIRLCHNKKGIDKLYQKLLIAMPNFTITNNERRIEIMNISSGKLSALKKICQDIDFPLNEVIFIGDEGNDIFCMKETNSFAMKNAPDWVKTYAKHITYDNENKGVEYVLQQFI